MVGMLRRDARFPPFQTWMPTTVLPTHHTKFETALQYGEEREVVAWRLHVRDISADGVPPTFLHGPSVLDWRGHFLRFTALWSHEMKRTSATREQGYHSWAGEHAVLAVPNVPIGPGGVPECDVEVALCARVAGRPDKVIGSAILTIDRPSHVHVDVELLPQDAVSGAVELPTVSLHIEVASLTREQADRQWGGDGNAATGMMSSQQLRTATQRSAHQTTQAAMQPTTQPTLQPQESPHSSIPVGEASDQEDTQSQQPPLSPTSRGETSGEEVAKPEGSHGNEAAWAATESRSTMYSSSTTGLLTPVASVAGGPSERGERQVSVHASANVQRSAVMGVQTGGGVRPVVGVGEADSRCRDRAEIEADGRCRDRAEIEADSRCRDAKALSLLVEGRGGGERESRWHGHGHTRPTPRHCYTWCPQACPCRAIRKPAPMRIRMRIAQVYSTRPSRAASASSLTRPPHAEHAGAVGGAGGFGGQRGGRPETKPMLTGAPAATTIAFGRAVAPPPPPPPPRVKTAAKVKAAEEAGLRNSTADDWLRPRWAPSARLLMQLDEVHMPRVASPPHPQGMPAHSPLSPTRQRATVQHIVPFGTDTLQPPRSSPRQCARIKSAFVSYGLTCPTAAIEKGLLIPEDRPELLCYGALSVAERPLLSQKGGPTIKPPKAGKGKKGKGGGKKGGKKKK